jgi:type I restriction enzyme S subunit
MMPELRFSEFHESWELTTLGQFFSIFNGYAFSSSDAASSGCRWIKIADVGVSSIKDDNKSYLPSDFLNTHPKFKLREGDVILALTRPILGNKLKIAYVTADCNNSLLNQRVGKIITSHNIEFVKQRLQSFEIVSKIESRIAGTDPPNLSPSEISSIKLFIPSPQEQKKISKFLLAVDQKINLLTKKKEALETYKKGLMQKIFSQELRFKREDGTDYPEWTTIKLKDVLEEYSLKTTMNDQYPILSSTNSGLYLQSDYFKHQVASKDNVGYKVIRAGMVVLSPQNLWMGNINVNQEFEIGIVSPSYKIFKHSFLDDTIAKEWLINPRMLFNYMQASEQGASIVRRNLSLSDFYDIKFSIPSSSEETKRISKTVSLLDKELHTLVKKLEATTQLKKGLLQQMFV